MAKFMTTSDKTKGKKNKFNVDQKVMAKQSLIDWHSSYLCWSYGRKAPENAGYGEGEKEIDVEDLPKVYIWSLYRLSGKTLSGVVSHYGARDNEEGVDRKNVWVIFTFKTELGNIKYGTYVHEKDLMRVKKAK